MGLIESMSGKICGHSDMYFFRKNGKVFSGKICNPSAKEPTASQLAHTAPHSATPPPMRHTYQPQNLPIPPDSIKDMVSLNRECFLRAHVCII